MTIENLNIFEANTLADVVPVNENFETIRLAINSSENTVGDLSKLNTSQKNTIVSAINSVLVTINQTIPAGTLIAHASNYNLDGYLLCNGAVVSRTMYPKLFAAIGTYYGAGDGSNTFNLPNFQGCFLQGVGGASLGIGQRQEAGLPNITGWMNACTDNATGAFQLETQKSYGTGDYDFHSVTFDASRSSAVYGRSNTVTPQNYAVYYHIKY